MENIFREIYNIYVLGLMNNLVPAMIVVFFVSIILKVLIKQSFKIDNRFVVFIKKEMDYYNKEGTLEDDIHDNESIIDRYKEVVHKVCDKALDSYVTKRRAHQHRRFDKSRTRLDVIFKYDISLYELVQDVHHKELYSQSDGTPNFEEFSHRIFSQSNNSNVLFGILPIPSLSRFLQIIPGLMIVFGILGTFLGMMGALPIIGGLDLVGDPGSAKEVIASFLTQISFALNSSIVGITFSIVLTLLNGFFATDALQDQTIEDFEECLKALWDKVGYHAKDKGGVVNMSHLVRSLQGQSESIEKLVSALNQYLQDPIPIRDNVIKKAF
ncbi:MAG: hypothetical protein ISR65_02680 [Bacteriovoracaceae bacterium]|nr:hypothetical protein [Bacteriovoracaceae bacterium]